MADQQIEGLPAGALVEDIQAAPQQQAAPPTPSNQIEGLPAGALVEDMHAPAPAPPAKPQATIGPHSAGIGERIRDVFANSAIGHAMEQTVPGVARELGLTPTETVNSPTYQQNQNQLIAPNAAMSPTEQANHPIAAGIGDVAGGMTTPEQALILAGSGGLGELPGAAGKIAPKLLSAGFSTQQIYSALKEIPAFRAALADGDAKTAERIMTHMTLDVASASLGGQHAIGKSEPLFPGMDEAVTDFFTKAPEHIRNMARSAVDTTGDAAGNVGEQAHQAVEATKDKIFGTPEERQAKADEIAAQKLAEDTAAAHGDIKTAIPPTKSAMYEDQDIVNARPFLEEQNAKKPIQSVEDFRDAADAAVDSIEDAVRGYIKANPTDQIDNDVLAHVKAELSSNEREGFVDQGLKALKSLKLDGPLTVERADSIRDQLNQENTAIMKQNDYSRNDARVKNAGFAAREAAAAALRDAIYGKLEERGIKGVKEFRQQEGSLLKLRDAAQNHITKGQDTIEGSAGTFKGAIRHGLGRGSMATAGAIAGSGGGPIGAAIGGGLGYLFGQGVEGIRALQDLKRDQVMERSFGTNVTQGPNYPTAPVGPRRIAGALPERTGAIPVSGVPVSNEPEGSAYVASDPTSRAARQGLLLPEQAGPDSYPVVPPMGSSRGPVDWEENGQNVQQVRGFEDISGHNITGPNQRPGAIPLGPANDWAMGQRRAGTAIVKAEPGTPTRTVSGPGSEPQKSPISPSRSTTQAAKNYTGARQSLAKPTSERTVSAGGSGALSSEELKRNDVFIKYSKSGVPTYLGKQPDASLKPGEAILAVNKKTGAVRVQNTSGMADSDAIHKFGRDALKNFGNGNK